MKIDLMSFSLRTRLSHCGINGKHHAISLNNGRKHTIIVRYLNDLGFWSMILSRLLNLNGIASCLQLYTNLSRLNLVTFWKRNCKNIFQFFALDVTKMYSIFFSFCSMANLAKRCLRKVNFVLKQFALTNIGQRSLFFF